jgi:hypothetical protein
LSVVTETTARTLGVRRTVSRTRAVPMTFVSQVPMGSADEWLGGQVENYLGGEVLKGALEGGGVANVAANVFDDRGDFG